MDHTLPLSLIKSHPNSHITLQMIGCNNYMRWHRLSYRLASAKTTVIVLIYVVQTPQRSRTSQGYIFRART